MESILTSIKALVGLTEEYEHFDPVLITHINSVFFDLTQIGVGPSDGFFIEDKTSVWTDFIPELGEIEAVKTYMGLRVRLLFDPPTSSAVIDSMSRQIDKYEWRFSVAADSSGKEEIQNGE